MSTVTIASLVRRAWYQASIAQFLGSSTEEVLGSLALASAMTVKSIVLVVEFKVGASTFSRAATIQVWDYALDLKNFHEASHDKTIVPVLIATEAKSNPPTALRFAQDRVAEPIFVAGPNIRIAIEAIQARAGAGMAIQDGWAAAPYRPTPTIVEAARALFANHSDTRGPRVQAFRQFLEQLLGGQMTCCLI
jgi:hypothetical protein